MQIYNVTIKCNSADELARWAYSYLVTRSDPTRVTSWLQ